MSDLGHVFSLDGEFDASIDRITDALKDEGFGLITRIDIDKAFREELDVGFRRVAILGACNTAMAHKAVSEQPEIGLLLPCNVTVEEADGGVIVRFVNPEAFMTSIMRTDLIRSLADEATMRLSRAAEALVQ